MLVLCNFDSGSGVWNPGTILINGQCVKPFTLEHLGALYSWEGIATLIVIACMWILFKAWKSQLKWLLLVIFPFFLLSLATNYSGAILLIVIFCVFIIFRVLFKLVTHKEKFGSIKKSLFTTVYVLLTLVAILFIGEVIYNFFGINTF